MTEVLPEVLEANRKYAANFADKGIYDVRSGKLIEVADATKAGKAA
jgi:hypothetical protein